MSNVSDSWLLLSSAVLAGAAVLLAAVGLRRSLVNRLRSGQPVRESLRQWLAEQSVQVARRMPPSYRSHLQRLLWQSGGDAPPLATALRPAPADAPATMAGDPVGVVVLAQCAGALVGGLVGAVIGACVGEAVAGALLCTTTGALLPWLRLRDRVKVRQLAIIRELPMQLDLLTLAVESGLEFSQAVARLVEKGRPGPLRDGWSEWMAGLRLGVPRDEGLRTLADRTGVPAVASVVAAILQADRHGARLGRVLRLQAQQLRQERFQLAEKRAGEAPVKMLMPLVGCIFPAVFLVLLGPVLFQLGRGLAE